MRCSQRAPVVDDRDNRPDHSRNPDDGAQGFDGDGSIEADGGNPGANVHFVIENFGIEYRSDSNPAFIGDLTEDDSVTVGIDTLVNSIAFEGSEVSCNMIVEFRSHALAQGDYPYTSVWYDLGVLQAGTEWSTFSTSFAPGSEELPPGWGGYGAEDPDTAELELPPGVTFNLTITRGSGEDDLVFSNGFDFE